MAKFLVGVEIEQIRATVVVVEVEADTVENAERKAVDGAQAACLKATSEKHLGIGLYHEWSGDCFSCLGTTHEEDWNSGNWTADIKV